MSTGKNFDLLRDAVGGWGDRHTFTDCVMKGQYAGRRLVAWAENDAIGIRAYLLDEGTRATAEPVNQFMAWGNAFVKWGAFVQLPETGDVVYRNMLTSEGNEANRVDRVREWLGYSLGMAKRFSPLLESIIKGEEAKAAFDSMAHGDAGIRKTWIDKAARDRGSTICFDAGYTQEGCQIRKKMDEIETSGDVIDSDLAHTVCDRYRFGPLAFLFGTSQLHHS